MSHLWNLSWNARILQVSLLSLLPILDKDSFHVLGALDVALLQEPR